MKYLMTLFALSLCIKGTSQQLTVIEQDYQKALTTASQENKMLFIDFYTTWCIPCKKLDKLVFQNDSVKQILGKDFILLKYDAEKDSVFHLSKKHHIFVYPSAVVLNKDGYLVNRNYGFRGEDFHSLNKSVFEFTNQSIAKNSRSEYVPGYSNKIDVSAYPRFYIDQINRTNTKPDSNIVRAYFANHQNIFSESFFSTLVYFASYGVPEKVIDSVLKQKDTYSRLFGQRDVDGLLDQFIMQKFNVAIAEKSKPKFDDAVLFTLQTVDAGYAEWVQSFRSDFLKAENKWDEVFQINKGMREKGQLSDGAVNHFSWQVYEKCNDKTVIQNCVEWMKHIIDKNPEYAYLDTYAFLLFKAGKKPEARRVALLAIDAARKEKQSTKALEQLLKKL